MKISGASFGSSVNEFDGAINTFAAQDTLAYSRGRNFAGHYSVRTWNVVPVTSPIAVQFARPRL